MKGGSEATFLWREPPLFALDRLIIGAGRVQERAHL